MAQYPNLGPARGEAAREAVALQGAENTADDAAFGLKKEYPYEAQKKDKAAMIKAEREWQEHQVSKGEVEQLGGLPTLGNELPPEAEGGPVPPPDEVGLDPEAQFLTRERTGLPFENMGQEQLQDARAQLIQRLATEPVGKIADSMEMLLQRIEQALGESPEAEAAPEVAPEITPEEAPSMDSGYENLQKAADEQGLGAPWGRPKVRGTDKIMSPIMRGETGGE